MPVSGTMSSGARGGSVGGVSGGSVGGDTGGRVGVGDVGGGEVGGGPAGVVVPVVLGVATGDSPSPWAWVGMLVAVVGVTLASGPELSGDVSPRPVVLAGCAALGFGLALFCLDRGARESTLLTLWGMRLTSVTILVVVALVFRSVGGVTPRETPALLAIGCGDLLANGLFAYASSRGQVSIASVLGSLYPVVTVVWARFLLDERLRRVQQVGVALAVTGAGVTAL